MQLVAPHNLFVLKRNGDRVPVKFDAITNRLSTLALHVTNVRHPLTKVDCSLITQKIASSLYPGVKTSEIDSLAAETCAYMSKYNSEYLSLAGRIAVSNLHKIRGIKTKKWTENVKEMMNVKGYNPLLSSKVYDFIMSNADVLDGTIDYENDYRYDYFAVKTLQKGYLVQLGGEDGPRETPQEMLMRVSCAIYAEDMEKQLKGQLESGNLERALCSYYFMSNLVYTHATPTLFNAGSPAGGTSSCYLLTMKDDSIEGIYDTLKMAAILSKACGGIGISVTNIRATGSIIKGTNGKSTGLVPMLRVFNNTAKYVDQGGGKRKGAFAIYLEPWHPDIEDFVELKKNNGKEEVRARDLFYGLWVPDLFMKRVEDDANWSLFCPTKVTKIDAKTGEKIHLYDVWGKEFEEMYEDAERAGLANKTMKARDLWFAIVENQMETGVPYMMYKDSANRKSNQSNLGTIRGSNLCAEIVEYTSSDEVAVCTLCSVSLPAFCDRNNRTFDHDKLYEAVYFLVISQNHILHSNKHILPETEFSCGNQEAIGLGMQGLADAFVILRYPFESVEAKRLNREIAETIYFAALSSSCDLAARTGKTYKSFPGSPTSKGILQYDMWEGEKPTFSKWNWVELKQRIVRFGLRNSLLVAPMPTASTSQILGNNECFEPFTSNIYTRRVLAGEFVVLNKHLVRDLEKEGILDDAMYEELIRNYGSVQKIERIPKDIRELYKTVWEIKQKTIVDLAADRGSMVDQSQSMNIFMSCPTIPKVTAMHFYAWKKGLKTGMYYLRTQPAAQAVQITLSDPETDAIKIPVSMANVEKKKEASVVETCALGIGGPDCESCSG